MMSSRAQFSGVHGFLQRHWQLILLSLVGWSLLAAIPATSAYLGSGAPGAEVWWAMFKKIGLYYYMWGLLTPLLYRLTDRLPYYGSGLLATIPVHVVVMTTLSFSIGLIVHQDSWQEWLIGGRAVGYHSMSFFTYALIVLCSLAIKFYRLSLLQQREVADAKIQAAQLDNKLNLARVDSLRMQMNPHFLFNALNSIAALIDSDQRETAYAALEQLANLLRQALKLSAEDDVSLEEEIRFCKAYLSMEQIRFGNRLNVVWNIADDAQQFLVPAFVLQPSIENTIKHAVSLSQTPVTVTVVVELSGDDLVLEVSDNGKAQAASEAVIGLGISNLRERLQLRFGAGVLVLSNALASGYRTTVRIPSYRLATAPSE